MARFLVVAAVVALATGAVGSAAPAPGRTAALSDLQRAIDDERRMIDLLQKNPPRVETYYDRHLSAVTKLRSVIEFASTAQVPPAVEQNLSDALQSDFDANTSLAFGANSESIAKAVAQVKEGLRLKTLAFPGVQSATAPTGAPQCSDGKDNDGDGITDWDLEPGCSSSRDMRERSPFTCGVESRTAGGRLELSGWCTGAFSEVEFTLLDDLQLNGRFDISHAPSCSPPTTTVVRCRTKTGAQNPRHLVHARFATTLRRPGQRLRLRFIDQRKRPIRTLVVPVR